MNRITGPPTAGSAGETLVPVLLTCRLTAPLEAFGYPFIEPGNHVFVEGAPLARASCGRVRRGRPLALRVACPAMIGTGASWLPR